jgi:hypothetical protein
MKKSSKKQKDYQICFYLVDGKPIIREVYLLKREAYAPNGSVIGMVSNTAPLPDSKVKLIAKKLNIEYRPDSKRYVIVVNRKITKVENASWSFDGKGNTLQGKDILKTARLVNKAIKMGKSKDIPTAASKFLMKGK